MLWNKVDFLFFLYFNLLFGYFQEPKQKGREFGGSVKRKGIELDEDSPPRKATSHRRMAVVYDSDEEWNLLQKRIP